MATPGKPGTVQVRFADGSEHTLPVHGIRQLQILNVLDELGVKDWSEIQPQSGTASLQSIRFMTKIAAIALTFHKQEAWTAQRIQDSFADAEQIAKAFTACLEVSTIPRGAPHSITLAKPGQKPGAYS